MAILGNNLFYLLKVLLGEESITVSGCTFKVEESKSHQPEVT
jgi:hypothetical protein